MERRKDIRELGALLDIFLSILVSLASTIPLRDLLLNGHCAVVTSQHLNTGIEKRRVIHSQLMYTTSGTWYGRILSRFVF
jgi:hypothetical protein